MIMNELQSFQTDDMAVQEMTIDNRLEIIQEGMRKTYLTRLDEMAIVPAVEFPTLEEDLIDNVRLFRITEMVYQKGESVTDKFTTVFNTLSTYDSTVFIVLDSDGYKTDFYIGVRNNEKDENLKRSTVTLGDTLKNTLVGHFPGIKIQNENRFQIAELANKICSQHNITSVSVVGNSKSDKEQANEQFAQGLEKLVLAMQGRQYVGVIIAEGKSAQDIQILRNQHQELYTKLSPLQRIQFSNSDSSSTSRSKSFSEMSGKQKMTMLGTAVTSLAGSLVGAAISNPYGAIIGTQVAGQLNGFITSLAPTEQMTKSVTTSTSTTTENKAVTELLQLIDESLKRVKEFDSYGMWNVAGYFMSDDMSAAEIAASNYRSLMNGENSGREVSAINSWRSNNPETNGDFGDLSAYLSRFIHPQFFYSQSEEGNVIVDASTSISGKELGVHMGLPRATVPGLPVIEHAEFGKEVNVYNLFGEKLDYNPEDRMTLGRVFDLGQITNKRVELDNRSLNMHTFITGSTGSGKSNTVYQVLTELHQDKIPFLVIEPAKGEYKDVFGNWDDVNVYSTNPNISQLINLNPFMFPKSIHVLEHVDGLVEIFSVCWPMYDAMPAFFKDAILKSYESIGWDLVSSTFEGNDIEYPDFEVLVEQLNELIEASDYASDIKSNYRGALVTRVKSLTVGLNKFIFTTDQTPYEKLFDENCILDISRVKSNETKALLMGLMVYILNEYRVECKRENNSGLKHVTVLEEAHNLLKNTSGGASDLVGKSVEMLTQTIAEIRTYGEGFIIVDQSPSSVDIAAIKNTNTKIVLRTPEGNDREIVGKSMGLSQNQINEIAKLPGGVAVVYQNNWVSPVLTLVDKALVEESKYVYSPSVSIKSSKVARTEILSMLIQPWLKRERMSGVLLKQNLKVLDLERQVRKEIKNCIENYIFCGGNSIWRVDEIPHLQSLIKSVLCITNSEFEKSINSLNPDILRGLIKAKTIGLNIEEIDAVCEVLTKVVGDESDEN